MDAARKTELYDIQDMAINHAIEEMSAAAKLSLTEREDRGDRFFLTKMASQSFSVAARIEAFIMLKQREGIGADHDTEETENARIDRMIKSARSQVAGIVAKAKEGTPVRK